MTDCPRLYECSSSCLPRCITLHLFSLKRNCHFSDQACRRSKSLCIISWSSDVVIRLYILVSSAYIFTSPFSTSGKSFTNKTKRTGPSTEPCGIPLVISHHDDSTPFTNTLCFLPVKKSSIHASNLPLIPYAWSFRISLQWGTLSNAFLKSIYATSTLPPSSIILVQSSRVSRSCEIQDLPGTNPCWLSQYRLFFIICWMMEALTNPSSILLGTAVKLTGL